MDRTKGVIIEQNNRSGVLVVRDTNSNGVAPSPVTSFVVSPELWEGITLNTRPDLGPGLKKSFEDRGIPPEDISFSGSSSSPKSSITIRNHPAEEVARLMSEYYPVTPDDRFRNPLGSPQLCEALAKGYEPLRQEMDGYIARAPSF